MSKTPYCTPTRAVYRGITATAVRAGWGSYIRFVGRPEDLRRAGLLRGGDRIPKPKGRGAIGASSHATTTFGGELRLTLEHPEACARDLAFQRFLRAAELSDG